MAGKPKKALTKEHFEFLKELKKNPELRWTELRDEFEKFTTEKLTINALRLRWNKYIVENKLSKEVEQELEDAQMQNQLFSSISVQNTALQKALKTEKIKTHLIVEACMGSLAKRNFKVIKRPKLSKSEKQLNLSMHCLRSDAQVGSEIKPELTCGLGLYNIDIYKDRVIKLYEKLYLFREQDQKALGLKKLIIPNLGDHAEGETIYKGQSFYIDRPLIDQIFESLEIELNYFYLPLAELFEDIEIFCVPGNHGRIGMKGDSHFKTNADYIYYKCLQYILHSKTTHVKVHISESPHLLVQHGDFLFDYQHGDSVKSWMGIPFYGLDRMAKKVSAMFNIPIDYFCVGHFHSPANIDDTIIVNGTLVGGSNLSINQLGLTSLPSQKMFYFDNEKGINRETNLYLDKLPKLEANRDGILTPVMEELKIGR